MIYALVPVAITINQPSQEAWIALGILLVVLAANAATLFMSMEIIVKYTKPRNSSKISRVSPERVLK
jgi:hypothetical protein